MAENSARLGGDASGANIRIVEDLPKRIHGLGASDSTEDCARENR
jgi:hypothetical protein